MPPRKPRQKVLSFSPLTPTSPSNGSSPSPASHTLKPSIGRGSSGAATGSGFTRRPRRKPNASILNFFQKVPQGPRHTGDGLFVEGEYDDEEEEEEEERFADGGDMDRAIDADLIGLYEKENNEVVMQIQFENGLSRKRKPARVPEGNRESKRPVKRPFIIDDDDSEAEEDKAGIIMKSELSTPESLHCKRECTPGPEYGLSPKMKTRMDDDDNRFGIKNKPVELERKASGSEDAPPPLIADGDFTDDKLLNFDYDDGNFNHDDDEEEDGVHCGGDNWEEREERRFLEMLQEQENMRSVVIIEDEAPQCPICSTSLEGMKEDVSCTRCHKASRLLL